MKASTRSTRAANPLRIVADGRDDSPAAPEGNLPPVLTSFVGRERELSEVEGLLAGDPTADVHRAGRVRQDEVGAACGRWS